MKLLIKYASRSRLIPFFVGLDNIVGHIEDPNYEIVVALDRDDFVMNQPAVLNRLSQYNNIVIAWGDTSQGKIECINRGIGWDWDIFLNFSDDVQFIKKWFDNDIRKIYKKRGLDLFLHYNDGFTGDRVNTMSIIGRDYFVRDGYIYHPEYKNLWADVEAIQVAKMRDKYLYKNEIIAVHNNPGNLRKENDDLSKLNNRTNKADEAVYKLRKSNNYYES